VLFFIIHFGTVLACDG